MKGVKPPKSQRAVQKLPHSFFGRPAVRVARELIGKILVSQFRGKKLRARIVETEAYLGPKDLASHASKGRTPRTEVLFGLPGRAYVYFIYGMHQMLNVVVGAEGQGQAVLIRGAEPLDGWAADLSGPGKLTRAFGINRSDNGRDLTGGRLFFIDNPGCQPRLITTKRIGIDYAREWKDAPLRFLDADVVGRGWRLPRGIRQVANLPHVAKMEDDERRINE
jgi:DNA-3-methyladenine glycosylase